MYNIKKLIKSFKYAMRGFVYIFKNEQNFRIQLFCGFLVLIFITIFKVEVWEAVVLCWLIIWILTLELINTTFEKIVDILKPRIHSYVEVIKDLMAAAVLISSIGAAIIALLIFIPYILSLF